MAKLLKVVLIIAVYGFILITVNYIHSRFFRVNVVFYAAIVDTLISVVIVAALSLFWRFRVLSPLETSLVFTICLLLGYSFAISIPTVIDRSLSFYILEKLQQRGGSMHYNGFEEVFKNDYMREHRLVDIRLTEQSESGTIVIDEVGMVRLTSKGDRLAKMSRFYRKNFLPKHRLLMGEYTDRLTDPFREESD